MTRFKKCRGIHREKSLAQKWPEPVERVGRRAKTHMVARGWCG